MRIDFRYLSYRNSTLFTTLFSLCFFVHAQELKDTIIDSDFQYASSLELIDDNQKILFLAGSISRKFGEIDLSNNQVSCCSQPETRKANKKVKFLGRITLAGSPESIFWYWDKAQKKISVYTASFVDDTAPLNILFEHAVSTKPKSLFFNKSPAGNYFVIGFFANSQLHAYLVNEALIVEKKLVYTISNKHKRMTVMRSFLSDDGTLYLAQLNKIEKRKASLHLIRWELKSNIFNSASYVNQKRNGYKFKRLTADFTISVSKNESTIALVGTMSPKTKSPNKFKSQVSDKVYGLVKGFNCVFFDKQLKIVAMRDTTMNDLLLSKIVGYNKVIDPFYEDKYHPPIGTFTLRHVSFDSNNDLVAVFEDTPTDQDYYYGNLAFFRYANNAIELTTIPKVSMQPAQIKTQSDSLLIQYVLDTRDNEIINPDKNHKLGYYRSFRDTYQTEYAFINDMFHQSKVINQKIINLDILSEEVMGYTYDMSNDLLYLFVGKNGYKNNKLLMLRN